MDAPECVLELQEVGLDVNVSEQQVLRLGDTSPGGRPLEQSSGRGVGFLCAGTEKEMQRSGSEEEGRPACNLNEGKEERELEPGCGGGWPWAK